MTEVLMPQLSESMESGIVLAWLLEDGAAVAVGDELLEVETDKATMAVQAEVAGVLEIIVPAGESVAVGEPIAHVGDRAEHVRTPEPAAAAAPASNGHRPAVNGNGNRTGTGPATPVARRLARAHGVELAGISGTGPRGRITKEDVLAAAGIETGPMPDTVPAPPAPATGAAPPVVSQQPPPAPPTPSGSLTELTRLQQVVARRMTEAKATVPHFQVQTEADMGAALELRAQLKEAAAEGPAPSVNDLVVKAAAIALARHSLANGSYTDAGFELHPRVNVGVAVAADGALVVPTVFDTDQKGLGTIAAEVRTLAEKVRTNTITPAELAGATFTVSNLGMFGMTAITPVINPPQAAILGVGAVRTVLARGDDREIVDRSLLTLTLSCDHRILYGADASRFLAEIRDLLQRPYLLCL